MLFQTNIVDSTDFNALKKVRYGLYYAIVILCILNYRHPGGRGILEVLLVPERHSYDWIADWIKVVLILGLIGSVVASMILYGHASAQVKKKGVLKMTEKNIILDYAETEATSFELAELEKLEIRRASTYHLQQARKETASGLFSPPERYGNMVSFEKDGKPYKIEFSIDSGVKNKEFEDCIKVLRENGVGFRFFST